MIHSAKGYELPEGHSCVVKIDVTTRDGRILDHLYVSSSQRSSHEFQRDKEEVYERFHKEHGRNNCYVFCNLIQE